MAIAPAQLALQSWIRWAITAYEELQKDYQKYDDYYEGEHKLEFATDKWKEVFGGTFKEFEDNWCQVVVDALAQRMEIIGWKSDDDKKAADEAEAIWDESSLGTEEEDLHLQTLIKGDGYLIVWPNPDDRDHIDMFYNDALDVNVAYDPANKRRLSRGSKRWEEEDGTVRLNLYFRDRIARFEIPPEAPFAVTSAFLNVTQNGDLTPAGWERDSDVKNNTGVIPVFHFKNRRRGSTHGQSEIKPVIPIQNAVNKVLMDMMIASEFGGFKQKHMAGGGHPKEGWKAGANRIWATTDPNARFGQFDSEDLEQFTKAIEMLVGHIAKITQTPMHYFRMSGDMPSGEALKTAESGLIKKAENRAKVWGQTWSEAMTFAVQLQRGKPLDSPVVPVWKSPETRHVLEQAQTAQLKSILGIPLETLWSEHFGYSEEEIKKFKEMNKAVAATALAQMLAQVGQLPPGLELMGGSTPELQALFAAMQKGDLPAVLQRLQGMDISQVLAALPKTMTAGTTAGEATTSPQPNTRPPASPTRRSTGFKD